MEEKQVNLIPYLAAGISSLCFILPLNSTVLLPIQFSWYGIWAWIILCIGIALLGATIPVINCKNSIGGIAIIGILICAIIGVVEGFLFWLTLFGGV